MFFFFNNNNECFAVISCSHNLYSSYVWCLHLLKLFVCSFICQVIGLFAHFFVHLFIPDLLLFICSFLSLFVQTFILSYILNSFVRLFTSSLVRLFVFKFINPPFGDIDNGHGPAKKKLLMIIVNECHYSIIQAMLQKCSGLLL